MADDTPDLTAGVALDDIPADGLLAGKVGDADVMLARWTDDAGRPQVSALSAACTHRGAQLPTGLRVGDSVVCPFHHACFDLRNGEAVSAPAIGPLGVWPVTVDGDRVTVQAAAEPAPGEPSRVDNDRGVTRVVVVGGGAGGFAAVERLRRVGYTGALALVSAEPNLPLDRPELSKNYLSGGKQVTDLPLLPADWYDEHDVETHLAVTATALDLAERVVSLSDGTELTYDALVLSTGGSPVRPDLPGFDRPDAFLLRTLEDADAIIAASEGKRVVVVGSGFIGLETAAALRQREVDVTVVAPGTVPMLRQLGEDLGRVLRSLHEENGTRFVDGRAAAWDGQALELEDGQRVEADLLVVGLGVEPRTALAQDAGLEVDDGVLVDATFETKVRGVFAVGDIARFPDPLTGRSIRVEHWAQAQRSGALAAVNLLGGQQAITEPPFYWTQQFGKSFRLSGHADSLEHGDADGSAADRQLLVTFREEGRVVAAAGLGRDRDLLKVEDSELRQPAL
ncbi:FAD-dependent oxidoreductase [Microlunatus antarcticus]|uniref:NADPH-dependent 2,4-dienoyl-CoA reductase/sulfur reductase-like enzyme/nitrite reductase/ring-hydroxylating ferredoxin subunit n=1 Tax=Microlunatus antarcticus TaxID=53388 RepID=A0A7W5JZ31_9ACTN|nr:FAD-dependent oxidoreductase [Microlunatus antarcticus]MBB3328978.1 NADPH-dependent 2,4-dienoyl-CoA reductase/sulfur reductase-like enzyme/nitrite reductase/ring-hydroxylating ferredoxin subunit [Microlunatus antarcticus]